MAEGPGLQALASRVSELPPLPAAVAEVLRVLGQPGLSVQHCVALIEHDQALALRTLRLANSAFYGVPGRVGSVGDAVSLLGLRTVSTVLVAVAMHQCVRVDRCPQFDFDAYWRHAITSALAARHLAPHRRCGADQAFLAGLLHDCGQLALAAFAPVQAGQAITLAASQGIEPSLAEERLLGFAHPALGALVAGHWRFPADIVDAIAQHHQPGHGTARPLAPLVDVVQMADALAHALQHSASPEQALPLVNPALWLALALPADSALNLLAAVAHDANAMAQALAVRGPA